MAPTGDGMVTRGIVTAFNAPRSRRLAEVACLQVRRPIPINQLQVADNRLDGERFFGRQLFSRHPQIHASLCGRGLEQERGFIPGRPAVSGGPHRPKTRNARASCGPSTSRGSFTATGLHLAQSGAGSAWVLPWFHRSSNRRRLSPSPATLRACRLGCGCHNPMRRPYNQIHFASRTSKMISLMDLSLGGCLDRGKPPDARIRHVGRYGRSPCSPFL